MPYWPKAYLKEGVGGGHPDLFVPQEGDAVGNCSLPLFYMKCRGIGGGAGPPADLPFSLSLKFKLLFEFEPKFGRDLTFSLSLTISYKIPIKSLLKS